MTMHTEEKSYKCELYLKSLRPTKNGTLKSHMRVHAGEKPYKCHLCDKSFAYGNLLKRHMRAHTGENPTNANCEVICPEWSSTNTQENPYWRETIKM